MDEFFDYPDDETRQLTPGLNAPALLAITYHEDPDLDALKHMANDGNSDVLKSAILNGRLKNDLWALGLPEAEKIHRISISDTNSLYVEAVVTSKDPSVTSVILVRTFTNNRLNYCRA